MTSVTIGQSNQMLIMLIKINQYGEQLKKIIYDASF